MDFEQRVLQIAGALTRPAIFNDFRDLRPPDQAGGHYLFRVKQVLLQNGYICHEVRNVGKWNCDFARRWAPVLGGNKTHFHQAFEQGAWAA